MWSTVSVILLLIIILSVLLNGIAIGALIKTWKRLNSHDVILFSLYLCDFCQATIGYPLEITEHLPESNLRCTMAGLCTMSLALVSISLLTSLSITRMLALYYPFKSQELMGSKKKSLYFIGPSVLYGFLWGIFPLIGWSNYAPELESSQRCSINLKDKKLDTLSYLYCLLVFCYVVPVFIMAFNFIRIKIELRKISKRSVRRSGSKSLEFKASQKSERTLTLIVFVMIAMFIIAWTPYAIVVFLLSVGKILSLGLANSASLLGKSSSFFNPIIYAFLYKRFRKDVADLFCCRDERDIRRKKELQNFIFSSQKDAADTKV